MSTPPNSRLWQRIFAIFEDAFERPGSERQAFLDQACGDDEALRRGVEELLEVHDEGAQFLDRPMVERPGGLELMDGESLEDGDSGEKSARPLPFDTIGPYRILRQLGEGGMSTVYLAVRDDDAFSRRMVVKVVRSDLESEPMLRRLRAERQILASLEHPYVARLYDGGSTDEGRPYFVMEFIEGVSIDRYCEDNQLSVDDRLTLFRKVCAAVQYAHQNLVVHRDIKPSNILVTAEGEPKLLDFGIAKLLGASRAASDLEMTETWQRLMTPSYASPEQVRGKLVTTVSDVYSLGVLLYTLLTGRLPHELKGRSPTEIERLLTDTVPAEPSVAVTLEAQAPFDDSGWQRQLAGDVDAIVLKALRSTPQQRYASVERLAADIERFQRGLPVGARAGSWRYLAGKFVRRHRQAVALAAVVAVMLVALAGAMASQARRVAAERDKKAQVVSLIVETFALSNPYVFPDAELTVREALERSLPVIEDGLRQQPAVRAELLHTTGTILGVLGNSARAREQLEEALEIRENLYGQDHPEVAVTMSKLAAARLELLELEEAEALAARAVAILRDRFGPGHPDLADALIVLVSVHCYKQEYGAAEPLASEALALAREQPEGGAVEIAALEYLAQAHSSRGDYRQAVALNRQALVLYKQRYGEKYPKLIGSLSNLGLQLRRMEEFEAARRTYEEAMELQRATFGEDHADPILMNNLAGVYLAAGAYADAERLYRDTLTVVLDRFGPKHWTVFRLELRIAVTQIRQGGAPEAEQAIRSLLERRLVADDHWLNDEGLSVLGESLSVQGRCAEAEPALVKSFTKLLEVSRNARTREDAFARLHAHLERCGKPQEVGRYEAMLAGAGGE